MKLLLKSIVLFTILSTIPFYSSSQECENVSCVKENIVWGGNFALSFGSKTYVSLEPIIGYKITKTTTGGIGAIFNYLSIRDYDLKTYSWGGKFFISQSFLKILLLYSEYQFLNLNAENYMVTQKLPEGRFWNHALFLGGGIQQHIGKKSTIYALLLYDILINPNSPYINPVLKIGFLL